jgi:hypothetical protein
MKLNPGIVLNSGDGSAVTQNQSDTPRCYGEFRGRTVADLWPSGLDHRIPMCQGDWEAVDRFIALKR